MDLSAGWSFQSKRRTFLLGATVGLLAPVKARAQKRRRIGGLFRVHEPQSPLWTVFLDTLRTFGWSADNNLEFVSRFTGRDPRKVPALADELLSAGVELVLAVDTLSAQTLVQRTKTVPVIVMYPSDAVAAGLVSSLARPGGNVTGFSDDIIDRSGKVIEFAREFVPGLRRLAIMFNPANQMSALSLHRVETLAPALGLEMIPAPVAASEQLEPALASLAREQPQGLLVHSIARPLARLVLPSHPRSSPAPTR